MGGGLENRPQRNRLRRIHWGNKTDVIGHPFPYYIFLAGLVHLIGARHVIELGTHHGGSTKALAAGMGGEGRIITFDLKDEAKQLLVDYPSVEPHAMDANSEKALEICRSAADQWDLVYIDSQCDFFTTLVSFAIYGEFLRPLYAIMDDIALNDGMREARDFIRGRHEAVDAADIVRDIRPSDVGFGLVRIGT